MTSESSQGYGLTSTEAALRLARDGPNILDPPAKESIWIIVLTQMKSVLFLVTTLAGTLFITMSEVPKGLCLYAMVLFVTAANTIGEYTGQDAGEALARQMGHATARTMRDGQEVNLDPQELVAGDVVLLKLGDIVTADMVLLHCVDLQTNEAVLTGEPSEVSKSVIPKDKDASFPTNMLFKMTSVVAGSGKGEVVATGMRTQVGLIAKRLQSDKTKELSPIQRSINMLGILIIIVVCSCAVLIFLAGVIARYEDATSPCFGDMRCFIQRALLRGVMVPVALVPHGLPFAVTVMLNLSIREMSKLNAAVTKSTAVDYLSATAVICTDKTGTLTEGKMTAQAIVGLVRDGTDPNKTLRTSELAFYPLKGLNPNGGLFSKEMLTQSAMKKLDASHDATQRRQVFADASLPDWADANAIWVNSLDSIMARAHLVCGYLNCYGTSLTQNTETGVWSTDGNMTEGAVKVAAAKGGFWDGEARGNFLKTTCQRVPDLEVPFTSKRKMMATIHHIAEDRRLESLRFMQDHTHLAVLKGAPDRILPHLTKVLGRGDKCLTVPGGALAAGDRAQIESLNSAFAGRALRSLLLALRPLNLEDVSRLRQAKSADDRLSLITNSNLCFMSLWGIYDPPRAAVPRSVNTCHEAGIRVVMITGDQHHTAKAIAEQVGIIDASDPQSQNRVATCTELHVSKQPVVSRRRASSLSGQARRSLLLSDVDAPNSRGLQETDASPTNIACSDTVLDRDMYERRTGRRDRLKNLRKTMTFRRERAAGIHDARGENDEHEAVYKPLDDLAELTSRVNVWARALPTDKVAIVESLTKQGYIAAMTGDGVNDAPALKRASVGVSMGIAGTEVTKNAADLVLMDDNFATIVVAIREGRRIYLNTQKYVLCNMSLKFGECLIIFVCVIFHIQVPLTMAQQMVNMPLTHSACTMPFAWEEEEPYIMKVPPRQTKIDFVVPRMMWVWKCFPFMINFGFFVVLNVYISVKAHTGFGFTRGLVSTSHPEQVPHNHACEHAGSIENGKFWPDARPFHCLCLRKQGGLPWGKAVLVDQWGIKDAEEEIKDNFNRWTGMPRHQIFDMKNTDFKGTGRNELVEDCWDERGVRHNCWKDDVLSDGRRSPNKERHLLPPRRSLGGHEGYDCASYGLRQGQTMAYVTLQMSEILSVCSYRMDGIMLLHLHSNKLYLLALGCNLFALLLFVYSSIGQRILGFVPLTMSKFLFSAFLAFMVVSLNEVSKIGYRLQLHAQNEELRVKAYSQAMPGKKFRAGGEQEMVPVASMARQSSDLESGAAEPGDPRRSNFDRSRSRTPTWGHANTELVAADSLPSLDQISARSPPAQEKKEPLLPGSTTSRSQIETASTQRSPSPAPLSMSGAGKAKAKSASGVAAASIAVSKARAAAKRAAAQ